MREHFRTSFSCLSLVLLLGASTATPQNPPQTLTLPANVEATTIGAKGRDVWYAFHGTGTQVVISLCAADGGGADFDSRLGVYCAGCATSIAGNDDSCGEQSRVIVHTNAVDTYHVQVHGYLGATGTFILTVVDTGIASAPSAPACPPAPPPVGACCNCLPSETVGCTTETEDDCRALGGAFQGNGSSCFTAIGEVREFHASTNLPIPDNVPSGVSNTIHVPDDFQVADVNVNIGITYTWQSDLIVRIEHNGITRVLWSGSNGCTSGDNIRATADDSGTASSCSVIGGGPIHSVFFSPTAFGDGPLAVFNGQNAFGDWTMTAADPVPGDTGTLNFWGIDLIPGLPLCTVCGDGVMDRGEQCDDGNTAPFDGCTQCRNDPVCLEY